MYEVEQTRLKTSTTRRDLVNDPVLNKDLVPTSPGLPAHMVHRPEESWG